MENVERKEEERKKCKCWQTCLIWNHASLEAEGVRRGVGREGKKRGGGVLCLVTV